jgi:hypothetical protein
MVQLAETVIPVPKPLAAKRPKPARPANELNKNGVHPFAPKNKSVPAKSDNPKHPLNWVFKAPPRPQTRSKKEHDQLVARLKKRFDEKRATALARGPKRQ